MFKWKGFYQVSKVYLLKGEYLHFVNPLVICKSGDISEGFLYLQDFYSFIELTAELLPSCALDCGNRINFYLNHLKPTICLKLFTDTEDTHAILVDKLSPDHIYSLRPKPDIDPYSSLEDVGDTSSDEKPVPTPKVNEPIVVNPRVDSSENSDHETDKETTTSVDDDVVNLRADLNSSLDVTNIIDDKASYCMRTRKPTRHSTGRPRRSCNETVDYRKLDEGYLSNASISPLRKKPRPRADPKREPSRDRLLAHQRRFERKDPAAAIRTRGTLLEYTQNLNHHQIQNQNQLMIYMMVVRKTMRVREVRKNRSQNQNQKRKQLACFSIKNMDMDMQKGSHQANLSGTLSAQR